MLLVLPFVIFFTLLFDGYSCNFRVPSTQALTLSKMAEKIIREDEGSAALQKRVAEPEEVNAQLKASNVEMQLTVDRSGKAVTLLRRQLDEELENYDLLRCLTSATKHNTKPLTWRRSWQM
jgi:hypothetical protein